MIHRLRFVVAFFLISNLLFCCLALSIRLRSSSEVNCICTLIFIISLIKPGCTVDVLTVWVLESKPCPGAFNFLCGYFFALH